MINFVFQKNWSVSAVTGYIGGLWVGEEVWGIEEDPQRVFIAAPQMRNDECQD